MAVKKRVRRTKAQLEAAKVLAGQLMAIQENMRRLLEGDWDSERRKLVQKLW